MIEIKAAQRLHAAKMGKKQALDFFKSLGARKLYADELTVTTSWAGCSFHPDALKANVAALTQSLGAPKKSKTTSERGAKINKFAWTAEGGLVGIEQILSQGGAENTRLTFEPKGKS